MAAVGVKRAFADDAISSRKKLKSSDLPLTQHQHSTIDSLLHSFKKGGQFDAIRKKVFSQFESGDAKSSLVDSLTALVDAQLERNPALLSKDRRQAAPLVEGAVERSEIYRIAEADVDKLIDGYVMDAEERLREIRRKDVGDDVAEGEQKKGAKTDEEYKLESQTRRKGWAEQRKIELEQQRIREAEERRRLEVERKKQREEEEAKEKERKEQEEKRRLEWEAEREKEAARQKEWERELAERQERKKRQDAEWEKERLEREEKERKKREAEREKEMEAVALEELLRDSKRASARAAKMESVPSSRRGIAPSTSKESALATIMRTEKEAQTPKGGQTPAWGEGEAGGPAGLQRQRTDDVAKAAPGLTSAEVVRDMAHSRQRASSQARGSSGRDEGHRRSHTYESTDRRSSSYYDDDKAYYKYGERSSHREVDMRPSQRGYEERYSSRDYKDSEGRRDSHYPSSSRAADKDVYDRRASYVKAEGSVRQRSRSMTPPRRSHRQSGDYGDTHERGYEHDHDRHRRSRDHDSPVVRERERSRSRRRTANPDAPNDIDRYVPGGVDRKMADRERERDRERDHERERASRDGDYNRERDRPSTAGAKVEHVAKAWVEIDRYVPGRRLGGDREEEGRSRRRSRSRHRERSRSRDDRRR